MLRDCVLLGWQPAFPMVVLPSVVREDHDLLCASRLRPTPSKKRGEATRHADNKIRECRNSPCDLTVKVVRSRISAVEPSSKYTIRCRAIFPYEKWRKKTKYSAGRDPIICGCLSPCNDGSWWSMYPVISFCGLSCGLKAHLNAV